MHELPRHCTRYSIRPQCACALLSVIAPGNADVALKARIANDTSTIVVDCDDGQDRDEQTPKRVAIDDARRQAVVIQDDEQTRMT